MKRQKDGHLDELLPIELKLRLLETEYQRLESDARWIRQRCEEVQRELHHYQTLLENKKRKAMIRRVK